MKKINLKKLAVPMIYTLAIVTFIFSIYLVERVINKQVFKNTNNSTQYVDEEITNAPEYIPVINMTTTIMKPFIGDNISINKKFYDYNNPDENAIIFYEGTYMQNTGVDYSSENSYDIVSVLDGTVINIEKNEILGNTIEIRHDNDLISLYQCLNEPSVKVDDIILRGQVIAKSGTCNLYNKGNNLHFEIYHNGLIVNPLDLIDKNIEEIK